MLISSAILLFLHLGLTKITLYIYYINVDQNFSSGLAIKVQKIFLKFFWGIFLAKYIPVIHDLGNTIGGFAWGV